MGILSPDLFSLYNVRSFRELEVVLGVFSGDSNLNDKDGTVSIADTERKLQIILDNVVKESEKHKRVNYRL